MEIILIRHLPTKYNSDGILQGSMDIPIMELDDQVIKKIIKNKDFLNILEFDLVCCSELIRTQETSNQYGYTNFNIEPSINELNFGKYEGIPKIKLLDDHKQNWENNPRELILGESVDSFFKRIDAFVLKYQALNRILLFTHGAVGRYLISKYIYSDECLMNKVYFPNNAMVTIKL
jgi:probable phosphoglycerate mutase